MNPVAARIAARPPGQIRLMATVQLRRYWFSPGHLAPFRDWFPTVLPVRQQFGFRVLFALAEEEHSTFTWAVAHDGDEADFIEVEELKGKGVEFTGGIADFPWGRIAPFKDSEGNDLQFYVTPSS